MLIGSETWNCELRSIESLGGNVVIDELDNGVVLLEQHLSPEGQTHGDSAAALGRPHNPVKDNNWRRRPGHIRPCWQGLSHRRRDRPEQIMPPARNGQLRGVENPA